MAATPIPTRVLGVTPAPSLTTVLSGAIRVVVQALLLSIGLLVIAGLQIFWGAYQRVLHPVACSGESCSRVHLASTRWWARTSIWALSLAARLRLRVEGSLPPEALAPGRPIILVANHQPPLDIPALMAASPKQVFYVSRAGLEWIPALGYYLRSGANVILRPGKRVQNMAAIRSAGESISRTGSALVIFPEGRRSFLEHAAEGFHFHRSGLATLLQGAPDAVVLPVVIQGLDDFAGKLFSLRRRPMEASLCFLPPIDRTGGDEAVIEACRSILLQAWEGS